MDISEILSKGIFMGIPMKIEIPPTPRKNKECEVSRLVFSNGKFKEYMYSKINKL